MNKLDKGFVVELECKKELLHNDVDAEQYEYDYDLQNFTSVLYDLSASFYEREISLLLKVKGVEYVTFACELSIFLEELNNMALFVTGKIDEYALDFYEPGAHYMLLFERVDKDIYSLKFIDRDVKDFEEVTVCESVLGLALDLYTVYSKVVFLTKRMCPSIYNENLYIDWKNSIDNFFNKD